MKIRTGFVSNSSSSSFLGIGVKINRDVLLDKIGFKNEENDVRSCAESGDFYDLSNYISKTYKNIIKKETINIVPFQNYFEDGSIFEDVILYIDSENSFEDGEIAELDFTKDVKITEILEDLLKELKLDYLKINYYVQYVSNDNC